MEICGTTFLPIATHIDMEIFIIHDHLHYEYQSSPISCELPQTNGTN